VYFARAAARTAIAHIEAALVPGGLVVFGTMDVEPGEVGGLVRVGPPELMTFTNVRAQARRRPPTRRQPARAKSVTLPPEAVAPHRSGGPGTRVGTPPSAGRVLPAPTRRPPESLPGILERALFHVRKGEHAPAKSWMRNVLHRAEALPADDVVRGL